MQPALILEDVSKTYQRGRLRKPDLRSTFTSWLIPSKRDKEEFFALQDINLAIGQGEIVGIIGPNGAGKSTLLKLLSRITFPTKGKITIHGSLSSMLEIGTGFHPELTGRENIFLNGAIIGMEKAEVSRKLDSIIAFSGIEPFVDTPVKHYSSGMYVRLAFAVASHLEPDILLIDEVLAMGDQEYKRKCMEKLMDVSGQGRTIIMVSHQLSYLKNLCQTGVYLNSGKILFRGPMEETISYYVNHTAGSHYPALSQRTDRKGSGLIMLANLELLDIAENRITSVSAGQPIIIRLILEPHEAEAKDVEVRIEFADMYGHIWCLVKNSISGSAVEQIRGHTTIDCIFQKFPLNVKTYHMNVAIFSQNKLCDEVMNAGSVEVENGLYYTTGKLPPPNKGMLVDYYWKVKEGGQ